MEENEVLSINATQASAYFDALEVAIEATQPKLKNKLSPTVKRAMAFQVSTWEAEKRRLAETFPTLTDAVS